MQDCYIALIDVEATTSNKFPLMGLRIREYTTVAISFSKQSSRFTMTGIQHAL